MKRLRVSDLLQVSVVVAAAQPFGEEDQRIFEMTFWRVCYPDFPQHIEPLRAVLVAAWKHLQGKLPRGQRGLNQCCADLFEQQRPSWARYDAYLVEWPPTPDPFPEDDAAPEPDFREMGELLAQRIIGAFYAERWRRSDTPSEDRPVWRLQPVGDGRTPAACIRESRELHHWQSTWWREKTLPCERLDCRCRIVAMTVREAVAFSS